MHACVFGHVSCLQVSVCVCVCVCAECLACSESVINSAVHQGPLAMLWVSGWSDGSQGTSSQPLLPLSFTHTHPHTHTLTHTFTCTFQSPGPCTASQGSLSHLKVRQAGAEMTGHSHWRQKPASSKQYTHTHTHSVGNIQAFKVQYRIKGKTFCKAKQYL